MQIIRLFRSAQCFLSWLEEECFVFITLCVFQQMSIFFFSHFFPISHRLLIVLVFSIFLFFAPLQYHVCTALLFSYLYSEFLFMDFFLLVAMQYFLHVCQFPAYLHQCVVSAAPFEFPTVSLANYFYVLLSATFLLAPVLLSSIFQRLFIFIFRTFPFAHLLSNDNFQFRTALFFDFSQHSSRMTSYLFFQIGPTSIFASSYDTFRFQQDTASQLLNRLSMFGLGL